MTVIALVIILVIALVIVLVTVLVIVLVCHKVLALQVEMGGAEPQPLVVRVIGKHFVWPKSGCTYILYSVSVAGQA